MAISFEMCIYTVAHLAFTMFVPYIVNLQSGHFNREKEKSKLS